VDFVVTMAVGPRTQQFIVSGEDEVAVRELLKRHAELGDRQQYRSVRWAGRMVDVVWRNVAFPYPVDVTPVPNT
jgi:hypothetical protein